VHAPPGLTLIKPFEAAAATAAQLGVCHALLCVPTHEQREFARARWRPRLPAGAALATCILPEEHDDAALRAAAEQLLGTLPAGAALILDFVGHNGGVARRLRELLPGTAVIDVGAAGLATLEGLLRSQMG
jgi:hypothetical protein